MKFHYQHDTDGWINARVKSQRSPLGVSQIVSPSPLENGLKKFDSTTKEIVFYEKIFDLETGELIETKEDTNKPHTKIKDRDIIKKAKSKQ